MANFEGDAFERCGDDGERGDEVGVAVAFDDLRRDGRDGEAEALADFGFGLGPQMRAGADGSGDLADGDFFCGGFEAGDVTAIFVIPVGDFQAEGDGLGVDSVRAADLRRVFEFEGAALEDFGEGGETGLDELRGFAEEKGLRGVNDVI